MTKFSGVQCRFYIGGYDISAIVMGTVPTMERELADYAVMDSGTGWHHFPIIAKDTLTIEGILDDNYTAALDALYNGTMAYQVMIPLGTTQNNLCLAADGVRLRRYEKKSIVTDINKISVDLVVENYPFDSCFLHAPLATKTTSSTGTATNNGASSSAGCYGYLQITDLGTNDTLAVKVQDSSDNFAADTTDLLTFTTLDGSVATRTTERKTASGTVKQYTRISWTFGGTPTYSGTFAVAFRRL